MHTRCSPLSGPPRVKADALTLADLPPAPFPASKGADVLIVGAGPAGLSLACALADIGLHCHVLEQAALDTLVAPTEDGRDIALTHRARGVLESLQLWPLLPPAVIAPLQAAQVTNGQSPMVLPFAPVPSGPGGLAEPLGWLVPNHHLRAACFAGARARADRVTLQGDAKVTALQRNAGGATLTLADGSRLSAPLVVAADSRFSTLRRMAGIGARMLDFGRTAIVCRMAHEAEHDGIARECFLHGHTLAMLPMAGRESSAVWTVRSDGAAPLMALSDTEYAAEVDRAFGHRLGTLRLQGARHVYPLVGVYAQHMANQRFALVGDAAVGMHPVTAHGTNFGLYGVETLARELAGVGPGLHDAGRLDQALQAYAREHRRITLPIYLGTNAVVKLFTDDRRPARLAREAVIRVSRWLPPVRQAVVRQLTGR